MKVKGVYFFAYFYIFFHKVDIVSKISFFVVTAHRVPGFPAISLALRMKGTARRVPAIISGTMQTVTNTGVVPLRRFLHMELLFM